MSAIVAWCDEHWFLAMAVVCVFVFWVAHVVEHRVLTRKCRRCARPSRGDYCARCADLLHVGDGPR